MSLPSYTHMPVPANGTMTPRCIVIHRAENAPSNGLGLARYCFNNPGRYRWSWSVGSGGQAFKHLEWNEEGIHAAGLNDFAAGIEQDGRAHVDPWPDAQVRTTAQIVADFCRFIGKTPSRDFIIGHSEDYKFGGTSTHTDPGPAFPWTKFMGYVNDYYGSEEDDDMSKDYEDAQVNKAIGQANGYGLDKMKANGFRGTALPRSAKELADSAPAFAGFWYALGKIEASG